MLLSLGKSACFHKFQNSSSKLKESMGVSLLSSRLLGKILEFSGFTAGLDV